MEIIIRVSELFKVLIEKEDNVNFQVYLAIDDI